MASLIIETQPSAEPVALVDMKNFLRVEFTDDDALITGMIQAAREAVEAFCNRSLVQKGYRQSLDSFPYFTDTVMSQMAFPPSYYSLPRYSTTLWNYSQMIKLFAPPLVSVDRITFLSATDNSFHDLTPVPKIWYPGKVHVVNDQIMDNNGNVQKCTVPGTSQSDPPIWSKAIGALTVENIDSPQQPNGPTWQNIGPLNLTGGFQSLTNVTQAEFGSYIVDTDSEPGRIFPGPPGNFWPSVLYVPQAVQIHYTAGYSSDASGVPQVFKQAIQQLVAGWYENREADQPRNFSQLPNGIQRLLWTKRVMDYQPTRG